MNKLFALLTMILMAMYLTGCGMSDDTVAKVGSLEISKTEYLETLQKKFSGKTNFTDLDSMVKINTLNPIVESKRKLADAYALDLEDDEEVQEMVAKQRENMLASKYFEREIVDQLLPDEKIREYFEKQKNEFKASHILISFKGSQNPNLERTKDEAKQLAAEVYEMFKNGADFTELVMKYSDDPSKKRNKGDLGYFGVGRMPPSFEEAVSALSVGETSEPAETRLGFHIIRLEDRRENPKMVNRSFEDEYMNIKRTMYRPVAKQGSELWKKHADSLKTTLGFIALDENIQTIMTAADHLQAEQGKIDVDMFTADEKDLSLITWDGGEYTFGQLIKDNGNNASRLQQMIKSPAQIKQMAEGRALQLISINIAMKRGYDREKDVVKELDEFQKKRMLLRLEKVQVNEKIEITDEDKMKYYEENKEKFVNISKIEIWEIKVKTETEAKNIVRMAKSGKDFEELAKKYSTDKVYGKKGGYIGFKGENHRGAISREAFKAGVNTIVGPVKNRASWAVIKTGELKEKQYKSFEESEAQINSALMRKIIKERKKEWEQELLDNYPLTINHKVLNSI